MTSNKQKIWPSSSPTDGGLRRGLEPGEPNQGLVAEKLGSDARLPDYDDSGWESGADFQKRYSVGFTFAWYRLRFTMPETVKGQDVTTCRVWFETNVDNYGEVYIDGQIDRNIGAITGNNTPSASWWKSRASRARSTSSRCWWPTRHWASRWAPSSCATLPWRSSRSRRGNRRELGL